ncbi:NmrA family NAD(P)-binding protein [Mesorhizobium sp. ES1-4]|nr:NmrA family NAD(P)-binding protein [Mesorhizobium sp. ES1-4]MBZ9797711.1 NmrA family NAD(P)-binding protein [Mesorhizobium sp. ES1-4]
MILVTGATGLNGKAIVCEFARQRRQARALVRDLDRASAAGLGV